MGNVTDVEGGTELRNPVDHRRDGFLKLLDIYLHRQMEAGKWLLASLLLINGGALVAMLSNSEIGSKLLRVSAMWFVAGAVLAFIAGALSWFLSEVLANTVRQRLGLTIFKEDKPPINGVDTAVMWIIAVMWLASIGSLAAFGIGAYYAFDGLAEARVGGGP